MPTKRSMVKNQQRPEDDSLRQLGATLRRLRKVARLTQSELVARIGISRDTLSRVENGGSAETAVVQMIAAALGYRLTLERTSLRAADMRRRFAHLHGEDAD